MKTWEIVLIAGGIPTLLGAIGLTIQWQDAQDRVHQRTSSMRQSLGPSPGKRVPVLFDPDESSRGMIDSYVQTGKIMVPIGAALLVIGLAVATILAIAGVSTA